MIGTRVGHFAILDQLGQGGMGVVWKARDETLDRIVALKLVRIRHSDGAAQTAQLLREARMASALNHPNIVTVYEVGQHAGSIYVAMEYVEGQTLHHMIPGGGLSVDATLRIASQIADGLGAAHAAGLIHRDLKPSNIIITPSGRVKILDFGLASPVPGDALNEDETKTIGSITDSLAGTPAYMSPEQVAGQRVDARSDLFSVGALMYEALSGRPAFKGRSPSLTMAAVARDEPAPLENVPPEVERLVMRLLRKDPERRWQTALDLKAALDDLREESETHRLSPIPGLPPRARPQIWQWAAGGFALLVGAAAGVYAWLRPEAKPSLPEPLISQFSVGAGLQTSPSFSADGNQIAYAWNGNDSSNFDIYVQAIGSSERIRLTKDPAEDLRPVWSPTGERIAFVRSWSTQQRAIYVIGPLGGAERKVIDLPVSNIIEQSMATSWTRDGKHLIFGERTQPDGLTELMIVTVETGQKRPIDPKGRYVGGEPALSPDGRQIAFTREGSINRLWIAPFDSIRLHIGEARKLTDDDRRLEAPAWTADSRELIVTDERVGADNRLLRVSMDGAVRPVEYVGTPAAYAAVSPKGSVMAFAKAFSDSNIWKLKLNPAGDVAGAPEQLVASGYLDMQPVWSPDGQRIAFESTRSGKSRVWVADRAGAPLFQVGTELEQTGSPAWSPDGRSLVYDTLRPRQEVFTAPIGGGPRRLIATDYYTPWWSRDGKTILLSKGAPPYIFFFRVPASGGEFTRINSVPGRYGRETYDGRDIVFERTVRPGSRQLWKMPVTGGEPTLLVDKTISRSWDLDADGIWYVEPESAGCGRLMHLKYGRSQPRFVYRSEKPMMRGLSVSADRREILFVQVDGRGSNIMLLENFR